VARADNLTAILDRVVAAMQRPGLRGGAIFLINERNELYFGAHHGLADETVRDIRLPVGQGVVGGVAASGMPAMVHDLDAPPPGVVPSNRATGSNALTRSMVAVPIQVHGGLLGVLEMGCSEPDAFDAEDVAILERVADAIAGVIAQANPLKLADEVLRRRVRELSALQETAQVLNASLGLDVVLAAVAEHAARLVRTPYAAVHRVCDDTVENVGRWVQFAATDSQPAEGMIRACARDVPPGETHTTNLAHRAADELLPVTDPRAPLRSLAMVRLPAADGFDAVLSVASPDGRGFDPAQQRLLEGVAHLATLAIANAVRYQHLAEVAATDPLTGLLRRSQFEHALAETQGQTVSVLAVDVDHLKEVNDSAGHEVGDAALRAIAHTLRDRLGDMGVLARTAGDEFGVVLPGVEPITAVAIAEELRRSIHAAPVMIPWLPRASIGLATAAPDADPRAAWDAAMEALALAKRWGRDRVETRQVAGALAVPRQAWDALVPQLFEEGRIEAVFQPTVRFSDNQVVAYEALARPTGFLPATDVDGLFAAARAAGLHRDLDWACRRAAVRAAAGLARDLPLFLNVGVWALIDPLHDVDQMLLLLEWADLAPAGVVLEMSEREAVHDLERLGTVMDAYRAHGFRFSIDDVGEGHSTLDMLAAGAPEFIKIARSLVAGTDNAGAHAAIDAVLAFARSSGATVIAEGVETAEEAERMAAMGVPLGQGFWLGSPLRLSPAVSAPLEDRSTALAG